MLEEIQQTKNQISKRNQELEVEFKENNSHMINLAQIPSRKEKDLKIFEENLESIKKSIKKVLDN